MLIAVARLSSSLLALDLIARGFRFESEATWDCSQFTRYN